MSNSPNADLVWSIAELLSSHDKQSDYDEIVLSFTLLRYMDCVLAPTKAAVLEAYTQLKDADYDYSFQLTMISGQEFYNISRYDFDTVLEDLANLRANLLDYINGFSPNIRDIFDRCGFESQVANLDSINVLPQILRHFASQDLSLETVRTTEMDLMFGQMIKNFSELPNSRFGKFYAPGDVLCMLSSLYFTDEDEIFKTAVPCNGYDPAIESGWMLAAVKEYFCFSNPQAKHSLPEMELNAEALAIYKANMIKGDVVEHIVLGNAIAHDDHVGMNFDYMLSSIPFGVEWKQFKDVVRDEHERKGFTGRFGPGLPNGSDGSLLLLLHQLSKMRPASDGGSRIAILVNDSPLSKGGAGSGESNMRKWIIENDWLEAIVALPNDLFEHTRTARYIWFVNNCKSPERKGKIQLINATAFSRKMRKRVGSQQELHASVIKMITQFYHDFQQDEWSKFFDNRDFMYHTITIERPLYNNRSEIVYDKWGKPKPDPRLRHTDDVPLKEDIQAYFDRVVLPYIPDAWINSSKTKIKCRISFFDDFNKYVPPPSTDEDVVDVSGGVHTEGQLSSYASCFISYSSKDEILARQLYADLQASGVRCWLALHDLTPGDVIVRGLDEAIRLHDKVVLLLSEAAVLSHWVAYEVNLATTREAQEGRTVLYPLRLDDAVLTTTQGWAMTLREGRHIGDFRQWTEYSAYQAVFERLLRDLKVEKQ